MVTLAELRKEERKKDKGEIKFMTVNTLGTNRMCVESPNSRKEERMARDTTRRTQSQFSLIFFISGLTMKSLYILKLHFSVTNLATLVFNPSE